MLSMTNDVTRPYLLTHELQTAGGPLPAARATTAVGCTPDRTIYADMTK